MGCYQNKVSVITLDEEISRYVHCLMWEPAEGFSNKFLNKVFSSVFIPGSWHQTGVSLGVFSFGIWGLFFGFYIIQNLTLLLGPYPVLYWNQWKSPKSRRRSSNLNTSSYKWNEKLMHTQACKKKLRIPGILFKYCITK